jgi:TonB-linked SusC/RagA family outer membrane protein
MNRTTVLLIFCLCFFYGFSQNTREISGVVKDKTNNEPLLGASILIEGTSKGATTNINGAFKYTIRTNKAIEDIVLVVSYLGFKTQKVSVDHKSYFEILLEEDAEALGEVVITSSYGTKKLKEEIVGSIVSLTSEDLQVSRAVESVDQLLVGLSPGLRISTTSASPGAQSSITIRGQSSLSALSAGATTTSSQPLIVVDGVPISENSNFSGFIGEDLLNPLSKINTEDIESVSILKDAAAVGIYGVNGANGVILITTKAGKSTKPRFSFSTLTGVSNSINQLNWMPGPEYYELRRELILNDNPNASSSDLALAGSNTIDTEWFELGTRSGLFQKYNFSVGGKHKGLNYRTSLGYLKNETLQKGNNFENIFVNLNLTQSIGDKLSISLKASPSFNKRQALNTFGNGDFLPNVSPTDDMGNFTGLNVPNPLAVLNQNKNQQNTNSLLSNISLNYNVIEGLKFRTLAGIDFTEAQGDVFNSGRNRTGENQGGFRRETDRTVTRWNWYSQISYEFDLKEHHFDILGGFEIQEETRDVSRRTTTGFEDVGDLNSPFENEILFENKDEVAYVSYYTQLNYDWQKKYFLLANARIDKSSRFGGDVNTAINGSFGLSWLLSKESFLKESDFMTFLKLSSTLGTTGNSSIGAYEARGLYSIEFNNYNEFSGATPRSIENLDLTWETSTIFNISVNMVLWDVLDINMEYFNSSIKDQIGSGTLPLETGFSSAIANVGSSYNRGLEFNIKAVIFKTDKFKWTSVFNLSTVQTKITDLNDLSSNNSSAALARSLRVGASKTAIWGFNWRGVDPATGRDLFLLNNQVYDTAALVENNLREAENWQVIGDSAPDAFGGWRNNMSWNNFSLSFRFAYEIGGEGLIDEDLLSVRASTINNRNVLTNVRYRWRNPGDIATYSSPTTRASLINNSSKYLYDFTHVKLQNISLSYNFDQSILKNTGIKVASVFLNVDNVLYWYKDSAAGDLNGPEEFRFIAFPETRTISIGLKMSI